jgi:hypothetical protein
VAHGEQERHNAADQERPMYSGPKSNATGPSWVYDGQALPYPIRVGSPTIHELCYQFRTNFSTIHPIREDQEEKRAQL